MAPKGGKTVKILKTRSRDSQALENISSVSGGGSTAAIKGRDETVDLSSRKVGDDGSYFECVICDEVGDLICCDSCPSTYHLDCLEPPLESVPSDSWRCPNCAGDDEMLLPLKDLLKMHKRSKWSTEFSSKRKDLPTHLTTSLEPKINGNEVVLNLEDVRHENLASAKATAIKTYKRRKHLRDKRINGEESS